MIYHRQTWENNRTSTYLRSLRRLALRIRTLKANQTECQFGGCRGCILPTLHEHLAVLCDGTQLLLELSDVLAHLLNLDVRRAAVNRRLQNNSQQKMIKSISHPTIHCRR